MTKTLRIFAALLLGVLLASCDVHELPKGDDYVQLTFHLQYDEDMPDFTQVEYETKARMSEYPVGEAPYKLRTALRIYESQPGGTWSTTPLWASEHLSDDYGILDRDITISLPPHRLRALVWTDFIRTDGKQDFFSLENFPEVYMVEDETGGTDFKSSFYARQDIALDEVLEMNAKVTVNIPMIRPSAKIRFFASDMEEYIAELRKRASSNVSPGPDAITPSSININEFKLRATYLGFLPDAWNVREALTSDASNGHGFTSSASLMDNGNVYLGCDFVFVDNETTVDMMLEIFDDKGVLISRVNNLRVPIARGKVTDVTGRLLSHGVSGSVVIDPEFDGEFNIYL